MEMMEAEIQRAKQSIQMDREMPVEPFRKVSRALMLGETTRQRQEQARTNGVRMLKTYSGDQKRSSKVAKLSDLDRIELKDMQVRLIHSGKYLLCRTLSLPLATVGTSIIVASPCGNAVMVSLYNFAIQPIAMGLPSMAQLDEAFPIGTILAIKEPFIKMSATSQTPLLRVDSPTDFQFVNADYPLLRNVSWREHRGSRETWMVPHVPERSIDQWKAFGDSFFQRRHFYTAIQRYSAGLRQHPEAFVLYLNRAAAHLKQDQFRLALANASAAIGLLQHDAPLLEKAMYRKASALYGLRRWADANDAFHALAARFPSCVGVTARSQDSARRLEEQFTGKFSAKRHKDGRRRVRSGPDWSND